MKKVILFLAGSVSFMAAQGQGFQLNLQGTKQVAMGQHIAGAALDPSILFYNPGGIGFTKTGISGSFSPVLLKTKALEDKAGSVPEENNSSFQPPAAGYATFGIKQVPKLHFGIGVYTPFGSAIDWGNNWSGKLLIQNIKLMAISVQPTVSYKLTDKLGIGVGFVYTYGSVNLSRALDFESQNGVNSSVNLKGNGAGYSFNAGLYYKATEKFSVGISYRSQIKVSVKGGDATFVTPAALATSTSPTTSAAIPPSNKFSSSLPLPQVLSFGLGIKATPKLLLTLDVNWVGWSAYEKLEFDYDVNQSNTKGVLLTNTVADRKYNDILAYRMGAQYMLTEKFAIRGGVAYGMSPVSNGYMNPDVPDAERVNLSCGLGYQVNDHFSVDAAFLYEMLEKRIGTYNESGFTRVYKSVAYVPSIQLNYTF